MATNFGPEATNVSDIPSAQTPKEGITRQPIFLQGIGDIFGQAASLIENNKKSKQSQIVADFTQRQLLVSEALSQGRIKSSAHAQTLLRKNLMDAIEANPALLGDFLESQKSITGIAGAADNVKDGTQEEQRRNALADQLVADGRIAPDANDNQIDVAINTFRLEQEVLRRHQLVNQTLDEESKSLDISSKRRKEIEEQRKTIAQSTAFDISGSQFERVKNRLGEILSSDLAEEDKLVAVEDFEAEFKSQATGLLSPLSSTEISTFLTPFDNVFTNFKRRVTGELSDDALKRDNERVIAVATNEALKDPVIRNLVLASRLGGDSIFSNVLVKSNPAVTDAFVKFIAGTTPDGGTLPPSPFSDDISVKKGVELGLNAILRGIQSSDPELAAESEERLKIILSSIEDYQGFLSTADDKTKVKRAKEIVNWVASSEFADLRISRPDLFENVDAVADIINRSYFNQVFGMVKKEFRESSVVRESVNPESGPFTPFVPKILREGTPTPDNVGARAIDGGMEFFAINPADDQARFKAQSLNKDLKPIINTTLKAMSHLEGNKNYRQKWEQVANDILSGGETGTGPQNVDSPDTVGDSLSLSDFRSGTPLPARFEKNIDTTAKTAFETLSSNFTGDFAVISGFRSSEENTRVGGAQGSQHLHGKAFDIDVSNMSTDERVGLIRAARNAGFNGIGVYENSLHLDVGAKRAWGPSFKKESIPTWAKGVLNEN